MATSNTLVDNLLVGTLSLVSTTSPLLISEINVLNTNLQIPLFFQLWGDTGSAVTLQFTQQVPPGATTFTFSSPLTFTGFGSGVKACFSTQPLTVSGGNNPALTPGVINTITGAGAAYSDVTVSGNLAVGGTATVTGALSAASLTTTGNVNVGGIVGNAVNPISFNGYGISGIAGISCQNLTTSADVTCTGILATTGAASFGSTVVATGAVTAPNIPIIARVTVTAADHVNITAAGYVAGTSCPWAFMVGTLAVTPYISAEGAGSFTITWGVPYTGDIVYGYKK